MPELRQRVHREAGSTSGRRSSPQGTPDDEKKGRLSAYTGCIWENGTLPMHPATSALSIAVL